MNYTENYHLPQWVETDRILMKDFNAAMANIEEGLTQGSLGAAESAAKAQETADKAVAAAAAAQAKADAAYAPDQPPYAVGTYVGTNETVMVNVGFRPKFIIISGAQDGTPDFSLAAIVAPGLLASHVGFTDTGFAAYPLKYSSAPYSTPLYPDLSKSGMTYSYIAFR